MNEIIVPSLCGFTAGLLCVAFAWIIKTRTSVARLERKLDALLKHSGADPVDLA